MIKKYLIGLLLCSFVNAQTVSVSPFPASLTTQVTGTLPVANGGTASTTATGTGITVLATSPVLTTPTIGAAIATSVTASATGTTSAFLANNNLTNSTAYDFYAQSTFQSTVTTTGMGYRSALGTQATSFTLPNLYGYLAQDGVKGAGSTITNNHGFNCLALANGTNNYCFRGQTTAGANNYNLYMDGTAQNYLAGKTGIGAVSDGSSALNVTGTVAVTGAITASTTIAATGAISSKGISYTTSLPTISACGTSPSVDSRASNNAGTVTVGTIAASSCTITFATAFSTFNHCRVTSQSTIASMAYSYTLSAITVAGTSLIGDLIDYECDGI